MEIRCCIKDRYRNDPKRVSRVVMFDFNPVEKTVPSSWKSRSYSTWWHQQGGVIDLDFGDYQIYQASSNPFLGINEIVRRSVRYHYKWKRFYKVKFPHIEHYNFMEP